MFFRREKPHQWTFDERIANLKQLNFEAQALGPGKARVTRNGYGAIVEEIAPGNIKIGMAGLMVNGEIAELVNAGYQMFLKTPSGCELPALASQLKSLHAFDEDLREGLGLTSLYNLSLGTVSDEHLYDRVENRDANHKSPRPWETRRRQPA
ncbi:MAG TPA: hypothetical protein VEV85_02600 [Bryobacteraceae bacterium]|nr:hypothetical protein [Bryobacteraceae bacterium]